MEKKLRQLMMLTCFILGTGIFFMACGPKDPAIQTAVENALKANPEMAGLVVSVKDGVATLSGECKDETLKTSVEVLAKTVKGVKNVINNCTVAPPPPPPAPVVITPDDPLSKGVADALKDFPTAKATVQDGVISVTGELNAASWKKLKMALDGLRPKKVDASGLTIK